MTARVIPFPYGGNRQDQERGWRVASRFPVHPVSPGALIWVWRTTAKGLQQHVLLALANYHNRDTGQCNPSVAELSDCTGLGATTIRRTIRQLEEAGLIKTASTKGGRRQTARYTLMLDAASETRPERPSMETPETRPERPTSTPETRPEQPPFVEETRPLRPLNSAGAADVVPRTHRPEPTTTSAAVASPNPVDDGGLFGVVDPSPSRQLVVVRTAKPARKQTDIEERGYPSCAPAADAWYAGYVETHDGKPTDQRMGQVRRECAQLLKAGNDLDKVVFAARAAGMKGKATVNAEFDHLAANPSARAAVLASRPSTTDQRVATGQALIAKYAQEPA